jgi:hypothetical protein
MSSDTKCRIYCPNNRMRRNPEIAHFVHTNKHLLLKPDRPMNVSDIRRRAEPRP